MNHFTIFVWFCGVTISASSCGWYGDAGGLRRATAHRCHMGQLTCVRVFTRQITTTCRAPPVAVGIKRCSLYWATNCQLPSVSIMWRSGVSFVSTKGFATMFSSVNNRPCSLKLLVIPESIMIYGLECRLKPYCLICFLSRLWSHVQVGSCAFFKYKSNTTLAVILPLPLPFTFLCLLFLYLHQE